MNDNDDEPGFDGGGYDAEDWSRLKPFTGAVATLEDVRNRLAIFALGDTRGGRPIDMDLPQPVIWWEDDGEVAAVAVQAEAHDSEDGETMEVLGLVLPDGGGAVALLEDVDLVDDSDPVWRRLVTEAIGDETGEDEED
ncbi:hypothetical protein [Phenylobacterium sp.]|uniref:hypothetical protein n=1 Tax=Phenylobacterium sp. TaxID=1871053 RepID=UPI00289AC5D3|nr:hypothetical protein [Phenylobacterium sp.]